MKHVLTLLAAATLLSAVASAQYSTPVREVDVPAKSAFVLTFTCADSALSASCDPDNAIPAGYRFVVETINFSFDESLNFYAHLKFSYAVGSNSLVKVELPPTVRTVKVAQNNFNPLYARAIGVHNVKLYMDSLSTPPVLDYYVKSPITAAVPALNMHGYLVKK